MQCIIGIPVRLDHVVDGSEKRAVVGDSALQCLHGGRREPGRPVAGAVGESGKDLGLVEEHVLVYKVAEFLVHNPVERKGFDQYPCLGLSGKSSAM
jgi:hypothetical protein